MPILIFNAANHLHLAITFGQKHTLLTMIGPSYSRYHSQFLG